jgi:hypothetical protein
MQLPLTIQIHRVCLSWSGQGSGRQPAQVLRVSCLREVPPEVGFRPARCQRVPRPVLGLLPVAWTECPLALVELGPGRVLANLTVQGAFYAVVWFETSLAVLGCKVVRRISAAFS